jgi:hypothetical protein
VPRTLGVSVVIATLNGVRHVEQQLASIVEQTLKPIEIVVGDDGSTDGTVALIRAFAEAVDVPVHVSVNEQRLGYGDNFLRAATRARGSMIAFADQDDIWLPERLATAVEALALPATTLWISGWKSVDEQLVPVRDRMLHTGFAQKSALAYPLHVAHGSRMVVNAKLLDYMPPEGRPVSVFGDGLAHHDEWAVFAAHVVGGIRCDNRPLMLYRRHPHAVSASAPSVPSRRWLLSRDGEPDSHDVTVAARSRAEYLRTRAAAPACSDVRDPMMTAATYYEHLVPLLQRREGVQKEPRRARRAGAVATSLVRRDYRSIAKGGLGLWNLMQDWYAIGRRPANVTVRSDPVMS